MIKKENVKKLLEWLNITENLAKQSNKFYFNKSDYYSARIKTIKEVRKILRGD